MSEKKETNNDVDIEDKTFPEVAFAVDKAILREVEEMEEKVFTASLQVKVNAVIVFTKLLFEVMVGFTVAKERFFSLRAGGCPQKLRRASVETNCLVS